MQESARWVPSFRTLRFHGNQSERERLKNEIRFGKIQFDLCITTYEGSQISLLSCGLAGTDNALLQRLSLKMDGSRIAAGPTAFLMKVIELRTPRRTCHIGFKA